MIVVDYAGRSLCPWRNLGGGQFVPLPELAVNHAAGLGDPILTDLDGDTDLDIVLGGSLFFLDDGNQNYAPLQRR